MHAAAVCVSGDDSVVLLVIGARMRPRTAWCSRRRHSKRRRRSGADSIAGEVASREGHAETTQRGHAPLPVLRRRVSLTGIQPFSETET